jgi:hypothetical protein
VYDDDERETPPMVVGAVALGTAPLPFLAVYATLFIIHGSVHPVNPPDVTSSQHGELLAGVIALALFVLVVVSLLHFVNGRRRWPFAVLQAAMLGASIDFLVDTTKGGPVISVLIVVTTVIALGLAFAPDGWTHVGRSTPSIVERMYSPLTRKPRVTVHPATTPLAQSSEPTLVEPGSLRRQR